MFNSYFTLFICLFGFFATLTTFGQTEQHPFPYEVHITPLEIKGLDGHHSYAYGNYQYEFLIIGGRRDGIHARQPFNAFPKRHNNTDLVLIDFYTQTTLYYPINQLKTSIREQLQSSNTNFLQEGNLLYIIGGYAYSASKKDHITFPYLTIIELRQTIMAIKNKENPSPYIHQIKDERMAVTGGQLGKIDSVFYLIGGHRFDGRYNPMDNPTFVQTYKDEIASFTIDFNPKKIKIGNYSTTKDVIHLRRRDYNLLPRITPNGELRYTLSAGVFQIQADAPFTYPIDIEPNSTYHPFMEFTQYLSNYHSAKASFYDRKNQTNTTLFFGGLSQFYFRNDSLIYDEEVPFVKTLSILHRSKNNEFSEYRLPQEMPAFLGTSAEFLVHPALPNKQNVLYTEAFGNDTILIGYLLGGIESSDRNPFQNNETELTKAHSTCYQVKLIPTKKILQPLNNLHGYAIELNQSTSPNKIIAHYTTRQNENIHYYVTHLNQRVLRQGEIIGSKIGANQVEIELTENAIAGQTYITFIFDHIHFAQAVLR
jgi:hypothetical protein